MFRLAIIADDLTGAMDTGVQFAKRGLRTVVSLSDRLGDGGGHGAEVVVLNTNSRPDDPKVAAKKVQATGTYVRELGVERVYKKIDSTLRGNVGPELDALLRVWKVDAAVLTPAFPAVGRTVVGGVLLVNGVPWEDTQYAENREIKTSFIPQIIGTRRKTATVELADIGRGIESLAMRMRELVDGGATVLVADALSEDDLYAVAAAAVRAGLDKIMCGSGGLAEELPKAAGIVGASRPSRPAPAGGPVLVVAGTVNRVTIEQVRQASREAEAVSLEVLPHALRRDPAGQQERVNQACRKALEEKRDLIIASVPLTADVSASMVERDAAVAASLGPVVAAAVHPGEWGGIIMTGGDTAVSVCAALGVSSLEIEGEVEPGVPYGRLLEGPLAGQLVVTKAGGFGTPAAIANAIRFIKGRSR